MSTTRTGKIARLPQDIRIELNNRLQNGELGKTLVHWLNEQPRVKERMKELFNDRPVTEQNLSEWKLGGYQDWLRHEESRAVIEDLTEQHEELANASHGMEISDRFAGVLSVEFIALTKKMLEEKTDAEEKWQCLREVLKELSQLRRDDHRAVRTVIGRSRWELEVEREDAEAEKRFNEETKKRHCAPFWARLKLDSMSELFGGGEMGKSIAAFILEVQNDLPPGKLSVKSRCDTKPAQSASTVSNPTESD